MARYRDASSTLTGAMAASTSLLILLSHHARHCIQNSTHYRSSYIAQWFVDDFTSSTHWLRTKWWHFWCCFSVFGGVSKTYGRSPAHAFTIAVDGAIAAGDLGQTQCYVLDMLSTFDMEEEKKKDNELDTVRCSKTKAAMAALRATIIVSGIEISKVSRSYLLAKV